jgi:hypothetical protein
MAAAATVADAVPLKESGAITTRVTSQECHAL